MEETYRQGEFRVLSRRSDPETSHRAAREITEDGTRQSMSERAWILLTKHPARTACELEELGGHKNGQLRKRLNDLEREGLVRRGDERRCSVTGRMATEWWAVYGK